MEFADFTAQTLDIGIDGYDPNAVEQLKLLIKKKEPGSVFLTMPTAEMLIALGALKRATDTLRTTIAGLIILGKEPVLRDVLPSAEMVYLHMTNETEYDKRIDCAQPLLLLLTTVTDAIQQSNHISTIKIGLFDLAIPDYPPEVYREAIINSLIHRDYGLLSPNYVRHYSNRLEISNPGGFFGGVTTENILTHEPITRNPLLNLILHRIGLIEKAGIGIKRIMTNLLSLGKEPLQFETKEPFIQVIIRDGNFDEPFAAFITERTKEGKGFTLPELLVLSHLKRNREIEIKTVGQLLQRPDYKAKEIINSMIERGILEPFGQTKGTVYRLSKEVFTRLRQSVEYRLHRRAESAYAENLIMDYLQENGYITNEICRTLLRINRSQAQYLLTRLVGKKRLTPPAKGRSARYFRHHF